MTKQEFQAVLSNILKFNDRQRLSVEARAQMCKDVASYDAELARLISANESSFDAVVAHINKRQDKR